MSESIFGNLRRVVSQRTEVQHYPALGENRTIDESLYKYFFTLQSEIENKGAMDYHQYAARLWQDLVLGESKTVDFQNDPKFRRFEGNLISGLEDIDMKQHVYPELIESLGDLVAKYSQTIRRIGIWSTGDDLATGYQLAKIARSGIITEFMKALKTYHVEDIATKAEYLVADDKFSKLSEYFASHPDLKTLVVIEDSRSNLERVRKMVDELNQARPEDNKITFIPIWATYSREGMQAREKAEAEGRLDEFEREKQQFNAIDSPKDLQDDRFNEIFNGADVLVDFDGVIGNNITMREEQARVKYSVLMGAIMDREHVDFNEANNKILNNLSKLPSAA